VNSAELSRWLAVRPFQPFRIFMTDGTKLDVKHPEEVIAFKTTAYVARRKLPNVLTSPHTTISLLHLVCIEPFPSEG
jgi:hypothetical protein